MDLYNSAYAGIGSLTPIPADCGKLCNGLCCQGDRDQGMIIFPGEEKLLVKKDFLTLQQRRMQDIDVFFATCRGKCDRRYRPLSCRIFPLAPYYDGNTLSVVFDPRARYICPLLSDDAKGFISDAFKQSVYDAFSILLEDEPVRRMLIQYAKMLDEYFPFA